MKPRKLNLTEIHRLYKVLETSLPEKEEELLIDQIDEIVQRGDPDLMERCIAIMYPKPPKETDPFSLLLLFIKGLQDNNFFEYTNFITGLKRGKS